MPAVAAVGAFLGTTTGAIVTAGVVSAVQAGEQQKQIRRAEKKQEQFLAREREAVGTPEALEPGIREEFLEREVPRLEASLAARGMTRSSEFFRESGKLGVQAERFSREAALRRWQAQANVAQRQVEQAFGTAQVPGPGPAEAFLGGVVGQAGREAQTGAFGGGTVSPIFTGPTPGVTGGSGVPDPLTLQAEPRFLFN